MKNIFIIPTDQPTKLQLNVYTGKLILFNNTQSENESVHLSNQNLYITSENEDINENDYVITKSGELIQVSYIDFVLRRDLENASKVILTTDPTLIADGVQAIDDEFLEWFVKNSSCEFVEVIDFPTTEKYNSKGVYVYNNKWIYKITIPQEEPKQELPTYDESIQHILTTHKIPKELFGQEEPKQVLKWTSDGAAKWQHERMYTEDEVRELLIKALTHTDYNFCGSLVTAQQEIRTANFGIWFEENKKK